jgi:hypothetical protein
LQHSRASHLTDKALRLYAAPDRTAVTIGNRQQPLARQIQVGRHLRQQRSDIEAEHVSQATLVLDRDIDSDEPSAADGVAGKQGDVRCYCAGYPADRFEVVCDGERLA